MSLNEEVKKRLVDTMIINQKNHLKILDAIALYPYGSRVYETASPDSDFDHIFIANNNVDYDHDQFDKVSLLRTYSYNVLKKSSFQKALDEHSIFAIECISLPQDKVIISPDFNWSFKLDKAILRKSISEKCSNSFVKAKKKFLQDDILIGKKSLFHSLRRYMFGIQIAKHGKIVDFTEANKYWEEIKNNESINWEDYNSKYKTIFNNLATEFRKLCPKEKS